MTAATIDKTFAPAIEHLVDDLAKIEENVLTNYTLADAMREGSTVTAQTNDWGSGKQACALASSVVSIRARRAAGHL